MLLLCLDSFNDNFLLAAEKARGKIICSSPSKVLLNMNTKELCANT